MRSDCIIFGCGFYGRAAYFKLRRFCNVLYYSDNDTALHGEYINGVKIVSPDEAVSMYKSGEISIVICCRAFPEISEQLFGMSVDEVYAMQEGFMYRIGKDRILYPYSPGGNNYHIRAQGEKNILYVQNTACIRTHKIAYVMSQRGYKVYLLYTVAPPEFNNPEYGEIYEKVFTVFTADELSDFINNSEFDIIHSSNEPDILTNLLIQTNKKVVFDVHDTMSLCGYTSIEHLTLEHIANTASDGVIYTSQAIIDMARKRFDFKDKPVLCLENLIREQAEITEPLDKLSLTDGEIHCVYEGSIVGNDPDNVRYFEGNWEKLTDCGIHIHFYSQADSIYCKKLESTSPYLHYEGNIGSQKLVKEMTKYDCGIFFPNVSNKINSSFLETGTANKIYEYINSGIPVAVSGVKAYKEVVEGLGAGREVDLDGDIAAQIRDVCRIKVPPDILKNNRLTLSSRGDELEEFYQKVITKGKTK